VAGARPCRWRAAEGVAAPALNPERESQIIVEAAVETLEAARAAERAKADRIELCVGLDVGGTTPAVGLIALVRAALRIPVFVLVRARAGDFVYSREEVAMMVESIRSSIEAGADGIVTGALTRDGSVDIDAMRTLIGAARGVPVTFHRAFDRVREPARALEDIAQLGVARILTSGGAASALEGTERIAQLVKLSDDRVGIIAGGNVRAQNVAQILASSGVREVHSRIVDESSMRQLVDVVRSR
jgi:copper homeostasis protein